MKQIQVYKGKNSWLVAFMNNGCPDKEIISLFDTHHLPTAFTANADVNTVLTEIKQLNPDSTVTLS